MTANVVGPDLPSKRLAFGFDSGKDSASGRFDVVVIGGGPAGTCVGIALAAAGRSVAVIERSRYDGARVGEILPPEIRLPLMELGAWEPFLQDAHAPSPGIMSVWGSPTPSFRDFVLSPYGSGWHVDRRRFDAMLAGVAASRGVTFYHAARVRQGERNASGAWRVQFDMCASRMEVRAAVLVDATGRAASPIRRLGGRRVVSDRLVGVVGYLTPVAQPVADEALGMIEAAECGWWYSAQLPSGHCVAALMTDGDLLPSAYEHLTTFWRAELQDAPYSAARLATRSLAGRLRLVAASTSRMSYIAGDGRVAVGDAAATLDPLSSQGVYRALISGLQAALAVDAHLRGKRRALADYSAARIVDYERDLKARTGYYRFERRWCHATFWKRRLFLL
jgi:flavin-dependent dehydrogenase